MGFISSAFNGSAEQQSMNAKATQSKTNAAIADNAAADALQRGEQKANQALEAGNSKQAAQKVAYASAGVDTTSGSPATMISQTAMISQLESMTQRNNAAREAYGYKVQAMQYRNQASDYESGADAAFTSGVVGATVGGVTALGSLI